MPKPSPYHGYVVVDKPAGMTSHDVVDRLRRLFHTKRVGHTGTLDPDATGVLVLCLGQATRLVEYLAASVKHYVTEVEFGIETDTQDASGTILIERPGEHLVEADILALLPRFRGTIEQIPPMVSARHHQGKRLYQLAREGVTVEREARPVQIAALELTDFVAGSRPRATLEVTCSTGTYIRTLAADLGTAAGTGGTMHSLRRTWVGNPAGHFTLETAQTLEELTGREHEGTLGEIVLPMERIIVDWSTARLDDSQMKRFRHGQPLDLELLALSGEHGPVAVLDDLGSLCGVGTIHAGQLQPEKVFPLEIQE